MKINVSYEVPMPDTKTQGYPMNWGVLGTGDFGFIALTCDKVTAQEIADKVEGREVVKLT